MCSATKNLIEGSSINICQLSAHNTLSSWRALCAGRFIIIIFMTSVKLIITPARFVTQFVPAELKIMVSYTVLITT
jgi:hypothetical protein